MGNAQSLRRERQKKVPEILLTPPNQFNSLPVDHHTMSNNKMSWAGFSEPRDPAAGSERPSSKSLTSGGIMRGIRSVSMRRPSSRRFSDFDDLAPLANAQEGIKLSEYQQKLIKDAWTSNKKLTADSGVFVMRQAMFIDNSLKPVFGIPVNLDGKKLLEHPKFQSHAQIISETLEMCVDSLDGLDDALGPLLVSYGNKHVELEQANEFVPEYWQVFAESMCELAGSWKIRKNRVETIAAWRILVFFIVCKVHNGFLLELSQKKQASNESLSRAASSYTKSSGDAAL